MDLDLETLFTTLCSTLKERENTYGSSRTFFTALARKWSVTLQKEITAEEVALCLLDLKLTRLSRAPSHEDSLIDLIGYACLYGDLSRAKRSPGKGSTNKSKASGLSHPY